MSGFVPDGEARSRPVVTVAGPYALYRAILVKIITSSRVPSYISNAASRRVPSRWAVDAESGTLVLGPRWDIRLRCSTILQ